jgi:hypothetical protein
MMKKIKRDIFIAVRKKHKKCRIKGLLSSNNTSISPEILLQVHTHGRS